MDAVEEKLGSILGNPEMMQKIMAMAQSLGGAAPAEKEAPPKESSPKDLPAINIDPSMLQKLSGLTRQSSVDKEQQTLLHALRPYLNRERIHRLENAMRAAKMARFVASALNQQGSFSQLFR